MLRLAHLSGALPSPEISLFAVKSKIWAIHDTSKIFVLHIHTFSKYKPIKTHLCLPRALEPINYVPRLKFDET